MTVAVIFVLSLSARAANLDQHISRRLMAAKSESETSKIVMDAEAVRVARLACRIQISEKRIPEACYRALKLEKEFGLSTRAETLQDLDRRCEVSSRRLRRPFRADLSYLSRSCRASIRRAEELLAYKLEYEE